LAGSSLLNLVEKSLIIGWYTMTVGVYILYGMIISYDISLYHVLACCYIRLNLGFFSVGIGFVFCWDWGISSGEIGVYLDGGFGCRPIYNPS
jgi:hypothetical protein